MIESKEITNPFPGLRPFEQDEYRLFFGREGQSDALIERLQRSHFLAVVGTSGSGKSSLVRAGLLPALRGGMMAGAGSGWRIAIMRPGSDPIGNLAHSLAEKDVLLEAGGGLAPAEAEAVIEATLRRGSLGLVDAARQARLAEHEKLLLVVDQFEELFRFRAARVSSNTEDDASAFVKLLLEASQQHELSIYVVPTMRSDFLGDCAQFQGLPEAINDGQYLIPRMTRDERRFAITGPVGVKRCKITEPLVNRLMNDVGDNPDQLPILQHALMRTWDCWAAHRRNGEPIGLEHYEAVGTMSDALSKHADEAFDELPDERSRQIAEILFKSLTERGADNREIRRPTCLKDICDIANATALEVGAVIEVFRGPGRSFLMPPAGVALLPETVIDISHESLIRNWDRLKAWVRDEADSARIYLRLAGSATDYYQSAGGLLDDVTLQYVLTWRERTKPEWAWGVRYHPDFNTAMTYLELSAASRDARIEAEQERERRELETAQAFAQKQARAARRMRWLTAGMAVMFVLALAAAAWGFDAQRTATRLKDEAEQSAREAREAQMRAVLSEGVAKHEKDNAVQSAKTAREAEDKAEKSALAAKEEKVKADKSALAAKNEQAKAERSKKELEASNALLTNEKKNTLDALDRSTFNVQGVAAHQREDYSTALRDFGSALAILNNEQIRQGNDQVTSSSLNEARVSLLSNLGATLLKVGESDKSALAQAVASYECARSIFAGEQAQASADPAAPCRMAEEVARSQAEAETARQKAATEAALRTEAMDWAWFDLYYGAAHAYRDWAASLREGFYPNRRDRAGNVREQSNSLSSPTPVPDAGVTFKKAEEYFQRALKIQEKRLEKTDRRIAAGYQELAHVYLDNGQMDEAETALKRAVELRRLDRNEGAGLTAALRELGKFYADQSNFPAAARSYNELIDIQDKDVSIYDVSGLNGLTDSYSELAQLYSAQNDQARATRAFKVAGLIQYVALASRKYQVNKDVEKSVLDLAYQLDQLGDAYLALDRFAQAEETYTTALQFRDGARAGEAWRSYERLGNMFYNQIKDQDYAKNISNEDYKNAYDNAKEHYSALVSFFEPPPTDDVLKDKFGEGLERLARLEANDPSTYDAAERNLTTALGIRRQRADWKGEFSTLSALVDLYRKEKKDSKIDETYETWVASMNKYSSYTLAPIRRALGRAF
jgi:hypothetical protein